MARLLVLNGPNLNLLGQREPGIYGSDTLQTIENRCREQATVLGHECLVYQNNHEGNLLERIHQAVQEQIEFIIFNPAAYTHTSIALRDALLAVAIPFVEVHLSNVFARESFRHHSFLSDVAVGVISGLGVQGYELAIRAADGYLVKQRS